jgi:tetratricopeptide (TPR) repeat protein
MMFYSSLGRKAEAAAIVEQIKSRVEPDRAALVLASCYQAIGERDKAAGSYREALRARPGDPDAARRAAGFFKAAGLNDDAIKVLRGRSRPTRARTGPVATWPCCCRPGRATRRPGPRPRS